MDPISERATAPRRAAAPEVPRAVVDGAGRFRGGNEDAFSRIGLDPAHDAVRLPSQHRVAWESMPAGGLHRIGPGSGSTWTVDVFVNDVPVVARSTVSAENLAGFARTLDFGETVKNLAGAFAAASGLTVPIVVLIDPSGDPTFAGGTTQDSRQLAAMEQCRRAAAPMAIWQAFEEQRLIIDPRWIETVLTDDRFVPIRLLLPPVMEEEGLVYVTIPLRSDRTVIGVVAGFWPGRSRIPPALVASWFTFADDLALGIQFSELLRRAYVNGAEAERIRITDDVHAGIAQSFFALSLEIARASAGASDTGDLQVLQSMADQLSADVRDFLADGRSTGHGPSLSSRLGELASEITMQTGAPVLPDHRVDWDEYSDDFGDYIVRAVTEAFRNIAKHAAATSISFASRIDGATGEIVVTVADDGHGGQRRATSSSGVGLSLIRDLTARWDGRIEFRVDAEGAVLTIRVVPEYQSEWAGAQRILRSEPGNVSG